MPPPTPHVQRLCNKGYSSENSVCWSHHFSFLRADLCDVGIQKKKINLLLAGQLLQNDQPLQSMRLSSRQQCCPFWISQGQRLCHNIDGLNVSKRVDANMHKKPTS